MTLRTSCASNDKRETRDRKRIHLKPGMRVAVANAPAGFSLGKPQGVTIEKALKRDLDPTMIVWWATEVECASAIARVERDAAPDDEAATQAFDRLKHLAHAWHEVDPSDPIPKPPFGSTGCIHFAPPTLFSSPPPFSPQNLDHRHLRSSHSTTVWLSLHERRDSF